MENNSTWYAEMKARAEEQANERAEKHNIKHNKEIAEANAHREKVQSILNGVGEALERKRAEEYQRKIELEEERAREEARQKDILVNGKNDNNSLEERQAYRNLLGGLKLDRKTTTERVLENK